MLVETFECEETAAETLEVNEAARELIEKLDLVGQKQLISPEKKERLPYRVMTADEQFTFSVLCPKHARLNSYAASSIPLRVLQVAAHAKETGLFKELMVWHVDDAVTKDPVLVGIANPAPGDWRDRTFYLARWGEVLDEMPALFARAIQIARTTIVERLTEIIRDAKHDLETLDQIPRKKLMASALSLPNYSF